MGGKLQPVSNPVCERKGHIKNKPARGIHNPSFRWVERGWGGWEEKDGASRTFWEEKVEGETNGKASVKNEHLAEKDPRRKTEGRWGASGISGDHIRGRGPERAETCLKLGGETAECSG